MRRLALFFPLLLACAFCFCGMEVVEHREELGTLKEQSVEEGEKDKIAQAHETAFKKIEAAILSKEIITGVSSKQIKSKYGAPSTSSPEGDGQRWLYRSLKGRFLDKPWIFLYFDNKDLLTHWDCGHTPACPDSSP